MKKFMKILKWIASILMFITNKSSNGNGNEKN